MWRGGVGEGWMREARVASAGTSIAMSPWTRDEYRRATMESYAWTVMQCQHGVVCTREGGDINVQRKNGTDAEQCRGRGKRIFASREAART